MNYKERRKRNNYFSKEVKRNNYYAKKIVLKRQKQQMQKNLVIQAKWSRLHHFEVLKI